MTLGVLSSVALGAAVVRLVPSYLDDHPVVGFLLLLGALLCLVVAVDLWSTLRRRGMWTLGAVACTVVVVVYTTGALIGLPSGSDRSGWDGWVGVGLLAVSAYVVGLALWFTAEPGTTRRRVPRHARVAGLRH